MLVVNKLDANTLPAPIAALGDETVWAKRVFCGVVNGKSCHGWQLFFRGKGTSNPRRTTAAEKAVLKSHGFEFAGGYWLCPDVSENTNP